MGIRKKVTTGFVILAVLVVSAGVVSFFEMKRIGAETNRILNESNRNMALVHELRRGAETMRLSVSEGEGDGEGTVDRERDSLHEAGREMFTRAMEEMDEESESELATPAESFDPYRAVTPSLVTLGVILLMLMLMLYFVDIYYMKPMIGMNRGVKRWLDAGVPFDVKTERDETGELKDNIAELIARIKRNSAKQE